MPTDNSRAVSLERPPTPVSPGEVAWRHGNRGRSPVSQVVRRRPLSNGSVEVTGEKAVPHSRNGLSPEPFLVAKKEDNEGSVNDDDNNVEVRPCSRRAQAQHSPGPGSVVIDVDDAENPIHASSGCDSSSAPPARSTGCASGPVLLEDDDDTRIQPRRSRSRRNPGSGSSPPAASVEGARSRTRFPVRLTRRPAVLERPESEFVGEQFLSPARPSSGGRRAAAAPTKPPFRTAARPSAVLGLQLRLHLMRGLELLTPLRALERMSVLLLVQLLVGLVPRRLLARAKTPSYGKRARALSTLLTRLAHVWDVFDATPWSRRLPLPRLLGSLTCVLDQF